MAELHNLSSKGAMVKITEKEHRISPISTRASCKMKGVELTLCTSGTHHSCIFTVSTVVTSNSIMGAVSQACLTPSASYIIIVDWITALTKESSNRCRCGSSVTKLSAHHVGISNVPAIITHSAPLSIVVDLNTPFVCSCTCHQTDGTIIL